MNVVVTLEQRLDRTPDGRVWTQAASAYTFWQRYLEVFDGVRVVARIRDVETPPSRHIRADGPGVVFADVPYYLGPWQYLRHAAAVRRAVQQATGAQDAVIMRVGSQLANCLFPALRSEGRPYGVEVVGDPWDVFAPGSVRHPLRPLLRYYFWHQLRSQCRHACAASYVTEHTLQKRYPVANMIPCVSASSIMLPESAIATMPASIDDSDIECPRLAFTTALRTPRVTRDLRLVFVGSLDQLYKGPDVLLDAFVQCLRSGLKLRLTMIGDGKFRTKIERQAAQLGITDLVDFCGQLPSGQAIRDELDRANLFVLPSRTEGLPRALIEAMARALPCVASSVGGIPELLPPEDLVPPGNAQALAQKIIEVCRDPQRRREMATRNLSRSRDFHENVLRDRRLAFYGVVRERTEVWVKGRRAA